VCDIPVSQLPQPYVKGDRTAILIPKEESRVGIDDCKNNLHGRIIWPKGAVMLKIDILCSKLASGWKSLAKWGITPR
ncbi:DUF4283 domain protein, partial [Trifolium medium]|nr:DUF4283 domain protein [Trifolium medium]